MEGATSAPGVNGRSEVDQHRNRQGRGHVLPGGREQLAVAHQGSGMLFWFQMKLEVAGVGQRDLGICVTAVRGA